MSRKAVTFLLLVLVASSAWACQVPVFRYAFEQWNPERYRIVVLAETASEAVAEAVETLQNTSGVTQCSEVELVAGEQIQATPYFARLWKQHSPAGQPIVVTLYPAKASTVGGKVAHVSEPTKEALAGIIDSPVRREIAKRLSEGESAVWVLLESGQADKDLAARQALESQLALDAEWLVLPTPEEMEIKPEVLEKVKVKLRVDFSLVSVARDNAEEKFLVDSLLNSETDLRDFDEPIAFPIFGRGLVLYALVGQGISTDTIRAASAFICGPCSCQVKEQNPGFDLLLNHDWETAVGETKISQPVAGAGAGTTPKLVPIPAGRKKG